MTKTITAALILFASVASADPITTNVGDGCVESLPSEGAWFQSTGHFRFAVFWDTELNCDATIEHGYSPYVRFDDFDGTGGLRIEMRQEWLQPCARTQIDWQGIDANGEWETLDAVVVNPVRENCDSGGGGLPPTETPPSGVPEPAMVGLLLLALAWRLRA